MRHKKYRLRSKNKWCKREGLKRDRNKQILEAPKGLISDLGYLHQ